MSKNSQYKRTHEGKIIEGEDTIGDQPATQHAIPDYEGEIFDRYLHAEFSKYLGWFSPASFVLALTDWLIHLAIAPAAQINLFQNAFEQIQKYNIYLMRYYTQKKPNPCVECKSKDTRFQNEDWQNYPYNLYYQAFLLLEQFWDETTNIRGIAPHRRQIIHFMIRQMLDIFSPSNFPWTNPEVVKKTLDSSGINYVKGFNNFLEDVARYIGKEPPVGTETYKVGKDVAITPGKVIYQNHLIELIQYSPTTESVYAEPILFIPAWIMKYYILDLSSNNSMVKYLVDQGHTVFMISWRNPGKEDRNLGLNDYINLGIMAALDAVNQIVPNKKIHAVGYCIGGTLLMIAAAALALESREHNPFKSITLFAAQIDFKSVGELGLFIDESQLTYLEDIMWEKGYLDGSQMAGAFSMLRSTELIWSRMIRDYLLGERRPINDLMAWDYDTTRLPYKMHSEYLRKLFLRNDLVQGLFKVNDKNIALLDINTPIFCVSTTTDHVAPWRSVYKIHLFTKTEVTFVLTNGGHNAGIVSEPGHSNRSFHIRTHHKGDKRIGPDAWLKSAELHKGSWWPIWENWLNTNASKVNPPMMGNEKAGYKVLHDAPGKYVLKR